MAKNEATLLGEIVSLLRKQNQLSTRDRLKEAEEVKRQEAIDEETHEKVKIVVQSLVKMMDESSKIVGFFDKWDEVKRVKKDIKRTVIEEFDDLDLVKPITDRFMELAEVKFK